METTLLLDPDILYWVVGPLFAIMVAAGLLRHYVMQLMKNDKQHIPPVAQRAHNCLKQTTKIRSGGAAHYMTTWKWQVRKQHYVEWLQKEAEWCEKEHEKQQESGESANDNDPMSMMMNNPLSMMKGNMAFMVQNMVRVKKKCWETKSVML